MPPGLALGLPTPSPPGGAGMASLLPLAASMGVPPSQLGGMAAALLQAQSSVLGAQPLQHQPAQGGAVQQQQQQQQLPPPPQQKPLTPHYLEQQQQQQAAVDVTASQSMPPPAPLQALPQAEALQSMAAMLQAQASAIVGSGPALPPAAQQEGMQQQPQGAAQGGSGGAASAQSLPSLVGASAIQGHPLPPPFHAAAAATPLALQSFGGGAPAAAGGAAPPTVHSGAFMAPGPLAAPAGTPLLHPTATAVSEIQGSALPPVAGAVQQPLEAAAQPAVAGQPPELAAPLQQATSAVLGSGNGRGGSPRRQLVSPSPDPEQLAAEEERRRHAGDPPQPQAAVIVELPTADVAAASQGGGRPGGLPAAEPQEAAMLGGNSTFADAMELGAGACCRQCVAGARCPPGAPACTPAACGAAPPTRPPC